MIFIDKFNFVCLFFLLEEEAYERTQIIFVLLIKYYVDLIVCLWRIYEMWLFNVNTLDRIQFVVCSSIVKDNLICE